MQHTADPTPAPRRPFRSASPGIRGPVVDGAESPAARTPSPVEITAGLFRGRYTALILWNLFWGGKPFYQLFRAVRGVSHRGLVRELERLERLEVVERGPGSMRGGRVEYRLSHPVGTSIRPLLAAFYEWGLLAVRQARALPSAGLPPGPGVAIRLQGRAQPAGPRRILDRLARECFEAATSQREGTQ